MPPQVLTTPEEVNEAIRMMRKAETDAVIMVYGAFTGDDIAASIVQKMDVPLILWAPYEPPYAPVPEAAYAPYEAQPARPRRNAPPQPTYREPAPDPIPAETGYDPFYGPEGGDPYAGAGYDPRYAPEYPPEAEGWYGPDYMPRSYPRKKAYKPGDFKYFFWSGSIVAGMVLTIVAFVYASIV